MNLVITSAYSCILEKLVRTVKANKKRFAELTYLENFIQEAAAVVNQPNACLERLKKLCLALQHYAAEFNIYKLVLDGLKRDIRRLESGKFKPSEADYLGICLS